MWVCGGIIEELGTVLDYMWAYVCVCGNIFGIRYNRFFYLMIVWESSSDAELESLEYWSASGLEDGMTVGEVSKSISTSELGTLKTWSVSGWEDGITARIV